MKAKRTRIGNANTISGRPPQLVTTTMLRKQIERQQKINAIGNPQTYAKSILDDDIARSLEGLTQSIRKGKKIDVAKELRNLARQYEAYAG